MVYEDVDLSYRARLAGHQCWYVADAVVQHAGSGSLGPGSAMAVFYGQRNLEWVWAKNTRLPLILRTAPSHLAYSLAGPSALSASRSACRGHSGQDCGGEGAASRDARAAGTAGPSLGPSIDDRSADGQGMDFAQASGEVSADPPSRSSRARPPLMRRR
jgi:hypothetical protein